MFTCFWQLWDWLDPPPLFTTATMENKKLFQMQHENANYTQPQSMHHTKGPPSYHHSSDDYRPLHSPVFQNHPQYQSLSSNFAQINHTAHPHANNNVVQQKGMRQMSGGGTPTQLMIKTPHNQHMHMTKQQPSPHQLQPKPNNQPGQYPGEQLYQSTKRQDSSPVTQPPTILRSQYPTHSQSQSSAQFQQQYQQIQAARMQAQMRTQNDAIVHQQRTFALRQQLNPPVPNSQYQLSPSSSSIMSSQRSIPPSSLSLSNQYQPANNLIEQQPAINQHNHQQQVQQQQLQQKGQNQLIYQQNQHIQQKLIQSKIQQQRLQQQQQHDHNQQLLHHQQQQQQQQHEQNQIIIHQNHPNLVVNQACQTQISGTHSQKPVTTMTTSPSDSSSTPQTPTHQPLEKRKSGTQTHTLKSPITKRPTSAQISLSGWLYKQGSDGLKVWRKRYFVLAEYCLYYYKSQDEDKVLGSIPLPSYRVSACTPDDKIYRKFAFKCEHTNMRTYWLAAENAESMGQWVRALTAATMLQGSSESDQTSLNHSGENSDSGIHTYQSQQSKMSIQGPLTPASDGSGNGSNGGPQPLYANAPPKPRRANDGGYSSPSPENSIERYDTNYDTTHNRRSQAEQHISHINEPLYDTRPKSNKQMNQNINRMQQLYLETNKYNTPNNQSDVRSPYSQDNQYSASPNNSTNEIVRAPQGYINEYGERNNWDKEIYMTQQMQQQQQQQQSPHPSQNLLSIYPNAERRTPDTYGRSRTAYQNHLAQQQQQIKLQQLQQQSQQQPPMGHHELPSQGNKNISDYEDIYNLNQSQVSVGSGVDLGAYRRPVSPLGYQNSTRNTPNMPLRYTSNYLEPNASQHVRMRAHPAQSVVPRPHSADFLEYEARSSENARFKPEATRAPRPKSSLDINRTPDNYYYSEASYAEKMRQSALYLQKQPNASPGKQEYDDYPKDRRLSEDGHLSSILDTNAITPDRYAAKELQEPQSQSVPRSHRHAKNAYHNELFLRSASARLPRKEEDQPTGRDNERKREESMKRLLEWKQRMLQSPLTRKGAALNILSPSSAKSPVNYSKGMNQLQRSRSETNANAGYNSYSSDDEDEAQLSPAGRSSPTLPRTHDTHNSKLILNSINSLDAPPISTATGKTNTANEILNQLPNKPSSSSTNNAQKIHNIKSTSSSPINTIKLQKNKNVVNVGGVVVGFDGVDMDNKVDDCTVVVQNRNIKNDNNTSTDTFKKYNPVYIQKTLITQSSECNDDAGNATISNDTTTTSPITSSSNSLKFNENNDINYENIDLQKTMMMTVMKNQLFDKNQIDDKYTNESSNNNNFNENIHDDNNNNDDQNDNDDEESNTFEYTDDDINAALEVVDENDDEDNNPETLINEESHECHYMPMTPKKTSTTESIFLLDSIINSNNEPEENTYVEMTQGKYEKSILADDYDVTSSNYEPMIINSQNKMTIIESEPVYMELSSVGQNSENYTDIKNLLNNGKSTIKKSTLKKYSEKNSSNLPDILCASEGNVINDSSDQEEDNKGHHKKSRNRFSLSDTFRPASYYLGTRTPLQEIIDSSDSEIVSPPPIPSSAPPIDDVTHDNFDTLKRTKIRDTITHSSNPVLSLIKNESTNSSRLSLPEQFSKYKNKRSSLETEFIQKYKLENKMFSAESNYSLTTDDGSLTSSDYDLYNKIKLQSPSFSDIVNNQSDQFKLSGAESESESVQIRSPTSSLLDNMERKKRRRPLSEDSFSEIESIGSNFNEAISASDLDQYLNNLKCNTISYDQPTMSIIDEIHYVKPPKVFCNDDDDDGNETRPLTLEDLMRSDNHISSSMFDSMYDNDASSKLSTCFSVSSLKPIEETSPNSDYGFIPKISHTRDNSNTSESSLAPYYYSDIASRDSSNNDISIMSNKLETIKLNNERDIIQSRMKGISHIHNPINTKNENQFKSDKSGGRSLSMEILNVADKESYIGSRNLYEEKNLLKPCNNKIYYSNKNNRGYDMKYYNDAIMTSGALAVENMIYNETLPPPPPPPSVMMTSNMPLPSPPPLSQHHIVSVASSEMCASDIADNDDQSSSGDHLWEEDRMWRESLRRVSLRHARSLDDLSRGFPNSPTSVTSSKIAEADKKWGIDTLKKDSSPSSTYANQSNINRHHHRRHHPSHNHQHNQKSENDNDVYVQLVQPSTPSPPPVPPHHNIDSLNDVYEVLREDATTHNQQLSSSRYLDREKIRQWDSMSSGLISSPTLNVKSELDKYKLNNGPSSPTTSTSSSMSAGPIIRRGPAKKPMRLTPMK